MATASYLTTKFLVTGADTLAPRPITPYSSLDEAREQIAVHMRNSEFKQSGMIVWVPLEIHTVERPVPPIVIKALFPAVELEKALTEREAASAEKEEDVKI